MSRIKVYKYKIWNEIDGQYRVMSRMATRAFVEIARGEIIEGSELEIDSSQVNEKGQAAFSVQPPG